MELISFKSNDFAKRYFVVSFTQHTQSTHTKTECHSWASFNIRRAVFFSLKCFLFSLAFSPSLWWVTQKYSAQQNARATKRAKIANAPNQAQKIQFPTEQLFFSVRVPFSVHSLLLLKIHHNDNPVRASAWHIHTFTAKKKINRRNVVIHCIRNACAVVPFDSKEASERVGRVKRVGKWKRQICEQRSRRREGRVSEGGHTKWCK